MNRSHNGDRYPDRKVPRETLRRCTSTGRKVIKRRAKKRDRRDSLKDRD